MLTIEKGISCFPSVIQMFLSLLSVKNELIGHTVKVSALHLETARGSVASWQLFLGSGVDYVVWQGIRAHAVIRLLQVLGGEMPAKGIYYQKRLLEFTSSSLIPP